MKFPNRILTLWSLLFILTCVATYYLINRQYVLKPWKSTESGLLGLQYAQAFMTNINENGNRPLNQYVLNRKDGVGNIRPAYRITTSDSQKTKQSADTSTFPKILHQTWKNHHVPALFEKWIPTWMKYNPTWEYWFWTDEEMRQLVSNNYPDFLKLYNDYPRNILRADVFRYVVMYEYGGVYADLDVECLRPLDPIVDAHNCILTQEPMEHVYLLLVKKPPVISNAIIACHPRHAYYAYIVNNLKNFTHWSMKNALSATGPYMMTQLYLQYVSKGPNQTQPLYLAPPEDFIPTFDNRVLGFLKRVCANEFHDRPHPDHVCKTLPKTPAGNKPLAQSYTDHHWTGLSNSDPMGALKSNLTFDVRKMNNTGHR